MSYEVALERMPHRGPMQLIEAVLQADEDSVECRAKPHQASTYPLRVDGRLHNSALVELGAQAAAAHASLHGIGKAHVGLLLTLSNVEMGDTDADQCEDAMTVRAIRLYGDADSARYRLQVRRGDSQVILSGDAVLSMRASA